MRQMLNIDGKHFLAIALWVCAAGALWLLLSPTASERRARRVAADRLRDRNQSEWRYNIALENYRCGLEDDPTVIEREARKLGYGRPGEHSYALSPDEIRAHEARLTATRRPRPTQRLTREVVKAVVPALVLVLFGAAAMLFFADLRIDDPLMATKHGK